MGWAVRSGKRVYYASRRVAGKPTKVYLGTGPRAEAAAAEVEQRQRDRELEAEERRAEADRVAVAEGPLDELCGAADVLVEATLLASGFRRHDRGAWRRRRGQRGRTEGGRGDPDDRPSAEGPGDPAGGAGIGAAGFGG